MTDKPDSDMLVGCANADCHQTWMTSDPNSKCPKCGTFQSRGGLVGKDKPEQGKIINAPPFEVRSNFNGKPEQGVRERLISLLTFGLSDDGLATKEDLARIEPIVIKLLDLINTRELAVLDDSPIKKVYEQFKHLDSLLCDKQWVGEDTHFHRMCYDFWQAIRTTLKEEIKERTPDDRPKM